MESVLMSLKKEFQMFLTSNSAKSNIYHAKTMAYMALFVNNGNDKNPRSHARSHDKSMNINKIDSKCEQVSNFSHAYVREYFLNHIFILSTVNISLFIFFILTCAYIFLFTCSHFNKIKIKTIAYHVNDLKKSFTCHSHGSHWG